MSGNGSNVSTAPAKLYSLKLMTMGGTSLLTVGDDASNTGVISLSPTETAALSNEDKWNSGWSFVYNTTHTPRQGLRETSTKRRQHDAPYTSRRNRCRKILIRFKEEKQSEEKINERNIGTSGWG